jgi:putative ABC transport system permease protein
MLLNAIVLAMREIRRNVLRSSLTALGIIIGVASVIIMVTLGNGATAQVTADIANMGSNMLSVMPGQRVGPGGASGSAKPFRRQDVDALSRDVPSITAVAPVSTIGLSVISGAKNRSTTITGTTNEYFESGNWKLADGRWFSDSELRSGAAVCIIGQTTRAELLGTADAIGNRLRLRSLACSVIGVLQSKGKSNFGQDRDDTVVIPIRTMQRRLTGNDDIHQVQLSVRESVSSEKAQQDIYRLMRERRHIARDADDDFSIMDQQEIANTISGTTRTLTALLAAVAAISLLVGGIGIMNIMLVSVTERTREIGIRLAIGAFERDVLTQFLIEAVVLSVFGGAIGISLALTASFTVARALGLPFALDYSVVALAFAFSGAVGVVFGFFPARRAASLNPIDALRHE